MPQLFDPRGNEFQGNLDQIGGGAFTDARVSSATLGAANAEIAMDLHGKQTAVFDLRTAAMNATLVFEATVDGTNYFALPGFNLMTEAMLAAVIITTTHAAAYAVNVTGFRRVRCRVSAYTSGNIVVAARATSAELVSYSRPLSVLAATVTAAANNGATLTLAAPGAGLFHYLTGIEITRNATAALAGTATLVITTTNLPGSLAWSVGNAMSAGGTQPDVKLDFSHPIKSSVANTATTIVAPVPGAAVLWRINAYYYLGA